MPIGAQPHGRRGDIGRPYTPLTLRAVLATFGLVVSVVFAVLLLSRGVDLLGWIFVALAVTAVIDLVVVGLRLRASRR
jgi:choline-glycine betaine transporter